MTAVDALTPVVPDAPRRRARGGVARVIVLGVAAVYFLGPLAAAIAFTVQSPQGGVTLAPYQQIFARPATGQVGFVTALLYSLVIAVVTIVVSLALMIPTQLVLALRLPRWRPLVEALTLLPLVFPPVVFVVGISDVYGAVSGGSSGAAFGVLRWIRSDAHPLLLPLVYVVMAMPFVYRAFDAGIRAVDVTTLSEAARGLGTPWARVLTSVLLPCLRTAAVNASFLCFALVMGEYTVSSILLYTKPFPVWLAQLPTTSGQVQSAVSVFSLIVVEVLLLLVGLINSRSSRGRGI